jgi:hypothetical protein
MMFHQMSLDEALEAARQESFSSAVTRLNGTTDAQEAKEQGMAAAEAGADQEWVEAAENAVKSIAARLPTFTADDVMELLESYQTKDGRALGPVMTRMAKAAICKKTRETVPCRRKSRHGTDIRVWQSLIYSPSFS